MHIKDLTVTVELNRSDLWELKIGLECSLKVRKKYEIGDPQVELLREIYGLLGMSNEFNRQLQDMADQKPPSEAVAQLSEYDTAP